MELRKITQYLDAYLDIAAFQDDSVNGLQVENSGRIDKIGLAVDVCLESVSKARDCGCNLLVVHHGLFWGRQALVVGNHYQRIQALISADMALYAAHLPLDAHSEVGHNIQLARRLGLSDTAPFVLWHGRPLGIRGRVTQPQPVMDLVRAWEPLIGPCQGLLCFGPQAITTIGIVAGSATDTDLFRELQVQGIDLFVTGEPKHSAYHLAREMGLNIFYGGHYRTETFGMLALAEHLREQLCTPAEFIDTPCRLGHLDSSPP